MAGAQHKNEKLRNRHVEDMKHLVQQEKMVKDKTERELKAMRDDFTAQLAYQYVYKNHSFKRLYNSQQVKQPRPVSDKPEMYERERTLSGKLRCPRPLGSLRQIDSQESELKFPPIQDAEQTRVQSPRVNMMGDKSYVDLKDAHEKENEQEKRTETKMSSFPNIEGAMHVEVRHKNSLKEDDTMSLLSAPPAKLDAESEADQEIAELKSLDMAQNWMLMKLRQQGNYDSSRRQLPKAPTTSTSPSVQEQKREAWKRILPETPSRPSTVFPGTARTQTGMKKLLKREVSDVIENWSQSRKRNEFIEKIKEHNRLELLEHPMPEINPNRPISAIFREFRENKSQCDQTKGTDDNRTVIIRQMSPQPRVASPSAQRRSEYARQAKTPLNKTRNALRRTESEKVPESDKITSVSRTSSYREIPEAELLQIQENAHLTAAERIEQEKQKRDKQHQKTSGKEPAKPENKTKPLKGKRQLPPLPKHGVRDIPKESHINKHASEIISVLGSESNRLRGDSLEKTKDGEHINSENTELNSYTPVIKQTGESATGTGSYSPEDMMKMKFASTLYDRALWPKLSKRMLFNYEHFTRTPPDRNKRLERMAKNRKKIQMKNQQMQAEMRKGKTDRDQLSETQRPSTRVSFNEKVVVFQTI